MIVVTDFQAPWNNDFSTFNSPLWTLWIRDSSK
jgi:hypothetical protein